MEKYNSKFNFSFESDFNIFVYRQLVNEGRVFTTALSLYDYEAESFFGKRVNGIPYEKHNCYTGLIVTQNPYDEKEANYISIVRNHGEVITGVLKLANVQIASSLN